MKAAIAAGMFALASGMGGGAEAFADDEQGQVQGIELVDNGVVVYLQPADPQLEAVIIWMAVDYLPPNPGPNPPESYYATMQVMYQLAMAAVTGSQVTFVNLEPIAEGVFAWTAESALFLDWDTEFQESP